MIQFDFKGNPTQEQIRDAKESFLERMGEELIEEYTTSKNVNVFITFKGNEEGEVEYSVSPSDNLYMFTERFNENVKRINTNDQE